MPRVKQLALAPDGKVLWAVIPVAEVLLNDAESLQPWSLADRKPLTEPRTITRDLMTGLGNIESVAAGQTWVLAGCRDGTAAILQASDATIHGKWTITTSDPLTAVALSGDQQVAVAGTSTGKLQVLTMPEGAVIGEAHLHSESVASVALNQSGSLIATGSPDRTLRLWKRDSTGLYELLTLRFHAPVLSVHLSTDGAQLAALVSNESAVRIWNLDRLRTRLEQLSLSW
jgi:WD40 repeat protein